MKWEGVITEGTLHKSSRPYPFRAAFLWLFPLPLRPVSFCAAFFRLLPLPLRTASCLLLSLPASCGVYSVITLTRIVRRLFGYYSYTLRGASILLLPLTASCGIHLVITHNHFVRCPFSY